MSTHKVMSKNHANQAHILVVDDDDRIRDLVSRYLHEHDFVVLTASSGPQALELIQNFVFDALVVDVMMPGQTGLEFTQELRHQKNEIPVLLLTALGEAEDRIAGLESGADDYLPKPFEPRELILRLKAILKRSQNSWEENAAYRIGDFVFDVSQKSLVNSDGEYTPLTSMEVTLLQALLLRSGDVLSRSDLAKMCSIDSGERTIDVQITRLRRKLGEDSKAPRFLQTIRGKGYVLRAEKV